MHSLDVEELRHAIQECADDLVQPAKFIYKHYKIRIMQLAYVIDNEALHQLLPLNT